MRVLVYADGSMQVVSDEWLRSNTPDPPPVRAYEALVTDVRASTVAYREAGAPLDITVVIPQYKTLELTREAVASLRRFYPTLPLILVDDGSQDASTAFILRQAVQDPHTQALIFTRNRGHGPAVHAGIMAAQTRWVFTLDSDCVVERGGFLERMENRCREAGLYGTGVIYHRDITHNKGYYLSCVAALYDRDVYLRLPPFNHSGDPMEDNTRAAAAQGHQVECFPIFDYVWHKERGTRLAYGDAWDLTGQEAANANPRIALYGSTYISELCALALLEAGYNLVGYVPCRRTPTVPGQMPLPAITVDTPHDVKLSVQFDDKIKLDERPGYNLHTGLLPEWGGCDILYHTLKAGARVQGLTFHEMTDHFDQGPIISKITYPVFAGDDMVSLYKRMARLAPRFVVAAMELLDMLDPHSVVACESEQPALHRRGQIAPEDVDLYALTPELLRQAFDRKS